MCRIFTREGWTKDDFKKAYLEMARQKWALSLEDYRRTQYLWESRYSNLSEEEKVRWAGKMISLITSHPEKLTVFIAGGYADMAKIFWHTYPSRGYAIREIKLPANWNKLLAEAEITPFPVPKIPKQTW